MHLAAGGFNRTGDIIVIGGDNNAIRPGFARALQHMDNHRPVDIHQRFPAGAWRQTRRNNDHETHGDSLLRQRTPLFQQHRNTVTQRKARLSSLQISSCLSWL
jgi:hypothetical protein